MIIPLTNEVKTNLISSNGWNEQCPINLDRLRIIQVHYLDFNFDLQIGQLLAFDIVANNVLNIFNKLLIESFPIASVKLLDEFNYQDELSMQANNSSCFNNRVILNSSVISLHACALAIDVNPLQNPYLVLEQNSNSSKSIANIYPKGGEEFLNRANLRPGMVEPIIDIFYKNGFTVWGGTWNRPIDYHHFQVPRELALELISVGFEEGKKIWQQYLGSFR